MPSSGRKALQDVRLALPDIFKWSGSLPGCLAVGGRPSRISRSSIGSLPYIREWLGGHSGCLGVVWRPSRISWCVRDALPDVWEWPNVQE